MAVQGSPTNRSVRAAQSSSCGLGALLPLVSHRRISCLKVVAVCGRNHQTAPAQIFHRYCAYCIDRTPTSTPYLACIRKNERPGSFSDKPRGEIGWPPLLVFSFPDATIPLVHPSQPQFFQTSAALRSSFALIHPHAFAGARQTDLLGLHEYPLSMTCSLPVLCFTTKWTDPLHLSALAITLPGLLSATAIRCCTVLASVTVAGLARTPTVL